MVPEPGGKVAHERKEEVPSVWVCAEQGGRV